MRRIGIAILTLGVGLALSGCGGQLGRNSPTQVRLESTGSTVNFTNLHIIVSPNNGSAVSVAAASDLQSQVWASLTSNSSLKELDFTTTSQQVPYFVYVKNDSGVQESFRLRIFMDGNVQFDQTLTIAANSTTQEETVFRNNVQ